MYYCVLFQCDMWSIGITSIEMAETQPREYHLKVFSTVFMTKNKLQNSTVGKSKYSPANVICETLVLMLPRLCSKKSSL